MLLYSLELRDKRALEKREVKVKLELE